MVIDLNAKHRRIKVLEEKQGDVGPGRAQKVPPVEENKNDPLDCASKCQTRRKRETSAPPTTQPTKELSLKHVKTAPNSTATTPTTQTGCAPETRTDAPAGN